MMNLLVLSGLTLSSEALAWTSPLLNRVPSTVQDLLTNPEVVTPLCNHTERLFIGRMVDVRTFLAVPAQSGGHYPEVMSRVRLEVLSQVTTLGHQASSLTLHLPGGTLDDPGPHGRRGRGRGRPARASTFITMGFPVPEPGVIVAIALAYPDDAYPDDDYASEWPSYFHVVRLPDTFELPTSAEVTAAYDEVCARI